MPLEQAKTIFDKTKILYALYDSYENKKDGAVTEAAKALDYSREHASRKQSDLGIDTGPFRLGGKKTKENFKYFQKRILEEILLEKIGKYKTTLHQEGLETLQQQAPSISKDLSARLNQLEVYQLYLNRMSFVYKIAEDVLKDKYEELKDAPNAYKNLQKEFEKRYLRLLEQEAKNKEELAKIAEVSPRTIDRKVA